MEFIKQNVSYIPVVGVLLVVVIVFSTIYTTVTGSLHISANSQQIQLAEDGAARLNKNATPQSLVGSSVDVARSLASYTNIYDLTGRSVTGAGYLEGKLPVPPRSLLKASDEKQYHAVTWQPQSDVRIAAVVVKAKNYYVLSGQSLREVEKIESQVLTWTFLGGLLSSLAVLGVYWLEKTVRIQTRASSSRHSEKQND